jgi:hypothetical protein
VAVVLLLLLPRTETVETEQSSELCIPIADFLRILAVTGDREEKASKARDQEYATQETFRDSWHDWRHQTI